MGLTDKEAQTIVGCLKSKAFSSTNNYTELMDLARKVEVMQATQPPIGVGGCGPVYDFIYELDKTFWNQNDPVVMLDVSKCIIDQCIYLALAGLWTWPVHDTYTLIGDTAIVFSRIDDDEGKVLGECRAHLLYRPGGTLKYSRALQVQRSKFDMSWIDKDEYWPESCPVCTHETEVKNDGTTACTHCGKPAMLPCLACFEYGHDGLCDWNQDHGCTPFPSKKVCITPDDTELLLDIIENTNADLTLCFMDGHRFTSDDRAFAHTKKSKLVLLKHKLKWVEKD